VILGLTNDEVKVTGNDIYKVSLDLLNLLLDESSEIISVYYGEEVKEKEAETLLSIIKEKYPQYSVELLYGGQPFYYYYFGIE